MHRSPNHNLFQKVGLASRISFDGDHHEHVESEWLGSDVLLADLEEGLLDRFGFFWPELLKEGLDSGQ